MDLIRDIKPAQLWCVGDELDAPEPSRWNKGMEGEYANTLQDSIDKTKEIMHSFRLALGKGKPFIIQRSNHTDRVETYIRKYAPAFAPLRDLQVENLLGYNDLGITYLHKMKEIVPGWVMAHGDEGRMSGIPGQTALKLAMQVGKSVVCGHTHRLGLGHHTVGLNGKTSSIYGLEVGHMMDMKKASYLMTGTANWHQGLGMLVPNKAGKYVPYTIPIMNGQVQLP